MNILKVRTKWLYAHFTGALAIGALMLNSTTLGQQAPAAAAAAIAGSVHELPAPVVRTLEQMQAENGRFVPVQAPREFNFPTMDRSAYALAKANAAQLKRGAPFKPTQEAGLGPESPSNPTLVFSAEGVNQTTAGGWAPPDANGTVGHNHFVQVVNNHIDMYAKPSTLVSSVSLNSFVGYFTQPLFDPNLTYDPKWARWVFSCPAFPESATVQYFVIGVSRTSNPTSGFYFYFLNMRALLGNDTFFDYPHIAFDNDAIQWTANIFNAAGTAFFGSHLGTFAKSIPYNGLGGSFYFWNGLAGTLQPTLVRDQNVNTWLAAAPPGSGNVVLYALQNSARSAPSLFGPYTVAVGAYSIPPSAEQPGTAATLDTLDNRFQNHSTQRDNYIWNTHSVALGTYSGVRWYRINTTTLAVAQSGTTYPSATSDDFNPHMTANGAYAWLSWSSTDRPAGINAQIRFSGKLNAETSINGGAAMFTSPTFYGASGVQRWGDYSQVSLDPFYSTRAWIVNEKINNASTWGTRFGAITY